MDITDVRVKIINDAKERLKAVCTVTFDGEFVVRDIKVVEGDDGFFVAMPSRKLTGRCPKCGHKNQLRARHCEDCGTRLPNQEIPSDSVGRTRLYRDTAHPITPAFREKLQAQVIEAYHTACDEHVEAQHAEEERVDEPPAEPTPVEDAPVDRATADPVPADSLPADSVPADDAPRDDAPVDDAPVDDAPADDAGVEVHESLQAASYEDVDVADDQDAESKGQTARRGIEEYNSLIAGLKGGSGGSSGSSSSGRRGERRDRGGESAGRDRGRRGGRGSGRSRSDEDRSAKPKSESTSDRAADTKKEASGDRPAVVNEAAKDTAKDTVKETTKDVARDTVKKESKKVPASKPPRSAVKKSEPVVDAEPAFAAGLNDKVSVSKVAEEKPAIEDAGDVNDDSSPFGMGL